MGTFLLIWLLLGLASAPYAEFLAKNGHIAALKEYMDKQSEKDHIDHIEKAFSKVTIAIQIRMIVFGGIVFVGLAACHGLSLYTKSQQGK